MRSLAQRFLISLMVIAVFPLVSISQSSDNILTSSELSHYTQLGRYGRTINATTTIGTPFLFDKFIKGRVRMANGSETGTMYIRYNTNNNRLQFLRDKKILYTDGKKVSGFTIFGKKDDIVFKNGFKTKVDDITPQKFLRIAYDGNNKLLVRYSTILRKNLSHYNSATKKNKYESYAYYYIQTPEGKLHRLKHNKDVYKVLQDRSNRLMQYVKSNNINIKKESGLIEALKYYDKINRTN